MKKLSEIWKDSSPYYFVDGFYSFGEKPQEHHKFYVCEWDLLNKENFLKRCIVNRDFEKDDILQLTNISTHINIEGMSEGIKDLLIGDDGWYKKYDGKFYVQSGDFYTIYPYYGITLHIPTGKFSEEKIDTIREGKEFIKSREYITDRNHDIYYHEVV